MISHFGNAARGGDVCERCDRYCIEHACKKCSSYNCIRHDTPLLVFVAFVCAIVGALLALFVYWMLM